MTLEIPGDLRLPGPPLPIDAFLSRIAQAVMDSGVVVVRAEPGAGKTMRVPWALHRALATAGEDGEVWVTQPRRIAARLAARYVADCLGEPVGRRVGHQVRFEDQSSAATRLRFVTEGVLTRRLAAGDDLSGRAGGRRVAAVVLDEFHERHLDTDLDIALLRRLRATARPDLKLAVMSATLDPGPVAAFVGNAHPGSMSATLSGSSGRGEVTLAPVFDVPGRRFPVDIAFEPRPDDRPLATRVALAVRRLVENDPHGDILVFLAGAADIRRCLDSCRSIAHEADLEVLPLHGELGAEEQRRAVTPGRRRKVILSTNVAESAVTIDGVTAVIDSGLARVPSLSGRFGLPSLEIVPVAKSSCIQRAGRAGRQAPGQCLRLYTRADYEARADATPPEIARMDVTDAALALRAAGVTGPLADFAWFEAPPPRALADAESLLADLGAVDGQGQVTPLGGLLARLPLHPRLGRLLWEAWRRGVTAEGATLAALLSERDIRAERRFSPNEGGYRGGIARGRGPDVRHGHDSDLLERLDDLEGAREEQSRSTAQREAGLDPAAVTRVEKTCAALCGHATRWHPGDGGGDGQPAKPPASPAQRDAALSQAILAAFPDRVAVRAPQPGEWRMVGGSRLRLSPDSVVRTTPLLVALDIDAGAGAEFGGPLSGSRGGPGHGSTGGHGLIRWAHGVELEALVEAFDEGWSERRDVSWNAEAERVEGVIRTVYRDLVVETRRDEKPDLDAVAQLLYSQARSRGGARIFTADGEELDRLRARLDLVARLRPDLGVMVPDDHAFEAALLAACRQARSFAELREADFVQRLLETLSPPARAALDRLAPPRLALANGRSVAIRYVVGEPPSVELRLQEMFGRRENPRVGDGAVPVVLHLLAPNMRAVQVTSDLNGFWVRHYPALRKELCRKYPKHAWPEDPLTASPPPPRPPRGG